jgi:outer membrane protein assembly factor BamB
VTQTHVLWRLNKGSNVGSPVYLDGRLYWASDKQGIAWCVDAATGKIVYETRMTPRPDRFYASPVLVGDRLYYVSRTQGTYVVAAAPEYRLLAHNRLPDASPFNASPAVVDGRLLLRSDEVLYCIGER